MLTRGRGDVLAEICTTLARDGGTINNCVTEAELGSISRGGLPAMTGTRADGGWHISGRKIFVTGAPVLRFLATAVVLPPSDAAPQGELVSALVEGGSPGLSIEDTWSGALGLRGCGNYAVNYDNVFVPDARIVERVTIGGERKRPGITGWNLPLAAVYLGIGQAACDAACHYANNRVPAALGAPIAGQPHIQQWIGEIDLTLRAARTVLHDTARAWVERRRVAGGAGDRDRHGEVSLHQRRVHGDRDRVARRRRVQHDPRPAAGTLLSRRARRIVPAAAG